MDYCARLLLSYWIEEITFSVSELQIKLVGVQKNLAEFFDFCFFYSFYLLIHQESQRDCFSEFLSALSLARMNAFSVQNNEVFKSGR